ncbi:hypothetical protein WSK_2047, partial [Novosphingobium sp. Rr 2-17]
MARVGIDELPDVVRGIDTYDGDQKSSPPGRNPCGHAVHGVHLGAHQRD